MITISNPLPDVVSFYPVVQETSEDISPIQFAINQVKEKLERLKLEHTQMQQNRQVTESSKSIIQGTLDAGVGGGLPKYKVRILISLSLILLYIYYLIRYFLIRLISTRIQSLWSL